MQEIEDCENHTHPEAYCLMAYRSDDGEQERIIWNARNGVTPFGVRLDDGTALTHKDWSRDTKRPDHVPAVGDLVFVNLTLERARELRREFTEHYWDHPEYPMKDRFSSKEEAIEHLAQKDAKFGGDAGCRPPTLVVVDEQLRARIRERLGASYAARAGGPRFA